MANVKALQFWFFTPDTVEEIGHMALQRGLAAELEYDTDEIYEWQEGHTFDSKFEISLSRRILEGEHYDQEPVRVMLMYGDQEPDDGFLEQLAHSTAVAFGTPVTIGTVKFLSGEEYDYRGQKEIKP